MKTNYRWLVVVFGLSLIGALNVRAGETYRFLKEIPVGGDGGWDYLSVDETARRLYVTHTTKIVVIDLDKETVVGEIADTLGVHGFAVAPELGRGFSSNGKENKASIVDLKTLQTIAKVDTGESPDAILYEPGRQEVYTFNGRGQSATVFEAKTGKIVATVPLSGKPEFAVADPMAACVYVNIEDKNEMAVIETKTHTVVTSRPIAPGEEVTGMAFDAAHHRLFIGCHNKLMLMMDSYFCWGFTSPIGKVITSVPIGAGVDANAFDSGTQLAFASCGDGTVTIAHEDSPEKLTVVQTLVTERGARTMALDSTTHKIYLASAKTEPAPAGQRPKIIAGSFKILVYGLAQ